MKRLVISVLSPCLFLSAIVAESPGTEVVVTIENLQPNDGFYFTPVWLGFHDGSFDLFDSGSVASAGLETIAETGDAGPLGALFQSPTRFDDVVTSPGGFGGAPVFDPGESVTRRLEVPNAGSNQYLSFASMVIPSNDGFFGNGDPLAFRVFNADGSLAGPLTIEIDGSKLYDAGTEINTGMGAAFSAVGGTDMDENGTVALHPGLGNFVGTDTANATTIGGAIDSGELLARIRIVPEPSTAFLAALGGLIFCAVLRGKSPS